MKNLKILECTLRDGTYVVDFMIDTATFYSFTDSLIRVGFQHIEVGHGLGLGAYRKYSAGCNDQELWEKLSPLTEQAKLYSFFIPYVGEIEDFRIAREYGLYGLRFGVEPIYLQKYSSVIEEAKRQGLFVALNIMKSYTVTPKALAQIAATYAPIVDVFYIVDSAGFLLPQELRQYVEEIYDSVGMIPLGYHGHDNLGLGMANSLQMIDLGVEFIDTTLTGIGRSGGNVPTEALVAILLKKLQDNTFSEESLLEILHLSQRFRDFIYSKGKTLDFRGEDILFGYAGFHSSFENIIRDYSEKRSLDFYQLILDISKKEQIYLDEEVLDELLQDPKNNQDK